MHVIHSESVCIMNVLFKIIAGSQANLTEQIRSGKLGPILELGVTPSHVSLAQIREDSDDEGDEQQVQENKRGTDGTSVDDSEEYCINLESLGLGGNQITCVGVATLADGLKTNTRKPNSHSIMCTDPVLMCSMPNFHV